jgi:hypothetical protein
MAGRLTILTRVRHEPIEDGSDHQLEPGDAGGVAVGGKLLGDPVGIYAV